MGHLLKQAWLFDTAMKYFDDTTGLLLLLSLKSVLINFANRI